MSKTSFYNNENKLVFKAKDSSTNTATKHLIAYLGTSRSYMRMGYFSIIVNTENNQFVVGKYYDNDNSQDYCSKDSEWYEDLKSDRLSQIAEVKKILGDNPYFNELRENMETELKYYSK